MAACERKYAPKKLKVGLKDAILSRATCGSRYVQIVMGQAEKILIKLKNVKIRNLESALLGAL